MKALSAEELRMMEDVIRTYTEDEYEKLIWDRKSWTLLYHLSRYRQNIIEWFPITKDMNVLEINGECGALTGMLAHRAKRVWCVEPENNMARINRERNDKLLNLTVYATNSISSVLENESYDLIVLYEGIYDTALEINISLLKDIEKCLSADGKVLIIAKNRMGMKYWAGCKNESGGGYFSFLNEGIIGNKLGITLSELDKTLKAAGLVRGFCYYPHPDIYFPASIYSDARLPQRGELNRNQRNFVLERLQLFEEEKAFDRIIENNQFPFFSNGFIILAGRV